MTESWIAQRIKEAEDTSYPVKRLLNIEENHSGNHSIEAKLALYFELQGSICPLLPPGYLEKGQKVLTEVEAHVKGVLMNRVLEFYDKAEDKSLFLEAIYNAGRANPL